MTESSRLDQTPCPHEPGPPVAPSYTGPEHTRDSDLQTERFEAPQEPSQGRPDFPEQHAFRATFLWRFYRPEVIAAFRLVGDALCDLQNEAGAWGPKGGRSITWSELQAACEDLGHLAVYLDEVAGERTASELDEVSEALTVDAGRWAGQLARLVLDMRRSLDRAAEALDHEAHGPDPGTE